MKTNFDEVVTIANDLLGAIENSDVRKSKSNPNAMFIDTRDWCGSILIRAKDLRAAIAKAKGAQ